MIANDDLDDIVEATERILAAAPEGHRPSKVLVTYAYAEGDVVERELVPTLHIEWYA